MKRFLLPIALLAATLVCAEPADDWRALADVAKAFETLTRNAKAAGQATDLDLVEATLERLHAEIGLARATNAGDSTLERLQAAADAALRQGEAIVNAKRMSGLLTPLEATRIRLRLAKLRLAIGEALAAPTPAD